MALHLLQRDRQGANNLADKLRTAISQVGHCQRCRTLSETPICQLCANPKRQSQLLAVVHNPLDVIALEEAGFNGLYFVLMGQLSPLDGMGPEDIGIDHLVQRVQQEPIEEVLIATSATVEGEATAQYISDQLHSTQVKLSRLAHGVPMGGELEFMDSRTLQHAFTHRKTLVSEPI
jgi:recombination protein RecR